MVSLTKEQIENYRLTEKNGWYYSEQGLVLTDDENENVKDYLSKVFKLNEIDDRNNKELELMKKLIKN
jgi:hypothetical protein